MRVEHSRHLIKIIRYTEAMASKRDGASSSKQLETCLRERDRRKSFRELVSTLVSLIPPERLQGKASISEHFEEAANYVKSLEARVSELKTQIDDRNAYRKFNTFEVRDLGPFFEVTVNVWKGQIAYSHLLSLFESHDLDVTSAHSFELAADRFMHIILSKKTRTVDSAAMESLKETLRFLLGNQTSGL